MIAILCLCASLISSQSQHRHLNDFLNAQVRQAHPNNQEAVAKNRVEIKYKHSREADSFYTLPPSMHGMIPPALREKLNPRLGVKVRITHDQKTGEPLAKIIKARIIDLDIYSPMTPLDCRISINFEMRFDGDVQDLGEKTSSDRNKDRLSYTQSMYQIDLTQVTQSSSVNVSTNLYLITLSKTPLLTYPRASIKPQKNTNSRSNS